MAKYEFNGQTYEAPDDMSPDEVVKLVTRSAPPEGESATPQQPAYQPVQGTVQPEDLAHNQDWLKASRQLWKSSTGTDFAGTDQELADTGLDKMGWFNYNLPAMAVDTAKLANAKPEDKEAFLYLMETYDHLGYSWNGAWRFAKGIAMDPTTYVGLGTFGIGSAAGAATKVASKEALQSALKIGLRTAAEGAVYGAASDRIRQQAEIYTGGRDEASLGQTLGAAAMGAGAGAVLGAGTDVLATALRKAKPWEVAAVERKAKEAEAAAKGTVPAAEPEKAVTEPPRASEPMGDPVELPEVVVPSKPEAKPAEAPPATPDNVVPFRKPDEAPKIEPAKIDPDLPPATPEGAKNVMDAIREVASDSGARVVPETRGLVTEATTKATELLTKVAPKDMALVVEHLRAQATTPEEAQLLNNTFKTASDQLEAKSYNLYAKMQAEPEGPVRQELSKQLEETKRIRDNVKAGDTALSSLDGRMLGDRVGSFNTAERRGYSEESILAEHGIKYDEATPDQKDWAAAQYFETQKKFFDAADANDKVAELTDGIQSAFDKGDMAEAVKLTGDRSALKKSIANQDMLQKGVIQRIGHVANTALRANNEYVISTVFTTGTLIRNLIPSMIKTIYRPALDYAMKGPFDYAAYRQMVATYGMMREAVPMALRAAKASFDYERALLSTEPNKLLEHENIFKGRPGRMLRIMPRFLAATDEFFSQVNYRAYTIGQEVGDAFNKGMSKGLTGEELSHFVSNRTLEAEKHLFTPDYSAPHVIEFLRQTALDKGIRGDAVTTWVQTQLDKNGDLFRQALKESGKDYADDLLFKRRFSGENVPSKLAQGYENIVNKVPVMKLFGQLFFRTPVRVFEDGIRMTPGLNLLDYRLYGELLGQKGEAAKVKAEGQMFLSYAIGAWVMTQYALGNATSGGPDNYKTKRDRENAGDWAPYTLRVGGMNLSLRNLDPLSTAFKIWTNVMDRMNELEYRKAQGEFVDDKASEAMAWAGVAAVSTASAIKDANLMEGVAELWKMAGAIGDPEKNDMTFTRFFAQKAQLYVPNMVNKVAQQFDPSMPDPVTMEQYLRARINPADPLVSRQFDVLGNPRKLSAPIGALSGIDMASNEALKRNHSEKELAVMKAVSNLEIASGENFGVWPVKQSDYGLEGHDLRSIKTKDGKSTYYDRLQEIYRGMPVTDQLHAALVVNQAGTVGKKGAEGSRLQAAKEIIQGFREAATVKLLSQESGMKEDWIKAEKHKVDIQTGKFDTPSLPYQ